MIAIKPAGLLFGSLGRILISRYGFHGHYKAVLYTIYAARPSSLPRRGIEIEPPHSTRKFFGRLAGRFQLSSGPLNH